MQRALRHELGSMLHLAAGLADPHKAEGFEVVECGTAEAAELIVATIATGSRALIADTISYVGCRASRARPGVNREHLNS